MKITKDNFDDITSGLEKISADTDQMLLETARNKSDIQSLSEMQFRLQQITQDALREVRELEETIARKEYRLQL